MATALNVISLEQAKNYLAVDFPDHDALITSSIHAAVAIVEEKTSHRLYERPEIRHIRSSADVYDYPVKVVSMADEDNVVVPFKTLQFTLYTKVTTFKHEPVKATLNIGYATVDLIPAPLLSACYKLVSHLFNNREVQEAELPTDVYLLIRPYVRYASI